MNKKSLIFIALFIFISLAIFTSTSFAEDEDRSYTIPFANVHLYIQEDGSLHVVETITYVFEGNFRGVTRDIPLQFGESVENLNVSTSGAYSTFNSSKIDGKQSISVYLYSNPEKSMNISDRVVNVTYEYDFINVLRLFNDGSTLHYVLWGEGWDKDLYSLNVFVHLHNNSNITVSNTSFNNNFNTNSGSNTNSTEFQYWLNPPSFVLNEKWEGNTLEVNTSVIKSGNYFELKMILPTDYFNNPIFASIYDKNGIKDFQNAQMAYEEEYNFTQLYYDGLLILTIILPLILLIIYILFGRELKTSYQGIYEREPPTNDSPAFVNAIYQGHVGRVGMDGFKATILDLVNKKYLKMENFESSYETLTDGGGMKNPTILFNENSDFSNLTKAESSALVVLRTFSNNENKLDLYKFESDMKVENLAKEFKRQYDSWKDDLKKEYSTDVKELLVSEGYYLSLIVAVFGILVSGSSLFSFLIDSVPFYAISAPLVFWASVGLMIISVLTVLSPNYVFGHWTPKGKENKDKWENFKKYLNNFSLIKEHPPSSIVIWNDYLVFATALGIAKTVQKSMEKIIPKETLDSMDSYTFYTYGGYYLLLSSFDTGVSTASTSDSGGSGGGGSGGGSGGGGGGAF